MTATAPPRAIGETARARSATTAIRDADGTLTGDAFGALVESTRRWAEGWSAASVDGRWDAAVIAPQTGAFLAVLTGLNLAGWAVGVIDAAWTAAERDAAIRQLDPAVIVRPGGAGDGATVAMEDRRHQHPDGEWDVEFRVPRSGAAPPSPTPDGVFYIGFTSGSSGRPKAFARTHGSWWAGFTGLDQRVSIGPADVVSTPGPISSSHFLFGALHALHRGARVDLRAIPPGRPWAGESAPDAIYVVPSLLTRMLDAADPAIPGPRYLMCSGARLEPDVVAGVAATWPTTVLVEYYGASELSFVSFRRSGDGTPDGSVGRPFPGAVVTIRDEHDEPVGPGTPGRVFVSGPHVFAGYRGSVPESAAHRSADGAWTVGDIGYSDENGYLYVSGRGSSLIITGGLNVHPEEVEGTLGTLTAVAEVAVVGAPDPRWGEAVVAVIHPEPGAKLRRAELRAAVADRLAPAKRPRRYCQADGPLPRLRTGKLDRVAIGHRLAADDFPEIR